MQKLTTAILLGVLALTGASCEDKSNPQQDSYLNYITAKDGKVKGFAVTEQGAFLYTRRFRQIINGDCNNPPGGAVDTVFRRANSTPFWTYLGDEEAELVSFTPGDPAEVSGNPIDRTRDQVFQALRTADDFQPVVSGNDGDMNYDAGTGGTITVQPAPGFAIVDDGRKATGFLSLTSTEPQVALDGCEIFLFEDAELSGYVVELIGPNQKVKVSVHDYQNEVEEGYYGDDSMLAIDLNTLPGWTDPYVKAITVTDDGISQHAMGKCSRDSIDTSLELDGVAVRKDVLKPVPQK